MSSESYSRPFEVSEWIPATTRELVFTREPHSYLTQHHLKYNSFRGKNEGERNELRESISARIILNRDSVSIWKNADFIPWVVVPDQEIVLEDIGHVVEIVQEDIVQEIGRISIYEV